VPCPGSTEESRGSRKAAKRGKKGKKGKHSALCTVVSGRIRPRMAESANVIPSCGGEKKEKERRGKKGIALHHRVREKQKRAALLLQIKKKGGKRKKELVSVRGERSPAPCGSGGKRRGKRERNGAACIA